MGFPKTKTVKLSPYERAQKAWGKKKVALLLTKGMKVVKKELKRAKKKRVRLPSLPKLIRKADSVFSKWIRTRDGFKCVLQEPKCHGAIQCGHLIKRGKKSVRWSEINCHALCSYHNFLDNMEPQHYVSWFIKNYGALPYQDLVEKSRGVFKPSREFLNGIISKYDIKK